LPEGIDSPDIKDSKLLSDIQRRRTLGIIAATADIGIGVVSVEEIDRINIYKATLLAMKLALEDLVAAPDFVLVDGRAVTELNLPQRAIVKGDKLSISIAAASIVAKVVRDEMMMEFDRKFPQYNFAKHKGYATSEHLARIKEFGISPVHRRSFAPVRECSCPPLL
jgi:ribonuclease HII